MIAVVQVVQRFFGTFRFPALALAALAAGEALLLALLLVPAPDALAAFADDFRLWCLGWDPARGSYSPGYLLAALGDPLFLGAIVAWVWRADLRAARARDLGPWAAAGLALAALAGAGLGLATGAAGASGPGGEPAFPGAELRTAYEPPPLRLTDHEGRAVDLAALRGRVVAITGVYSTCGATCPMILAQARTATASLTPAEREGLVVLAVTLDPGRDTPEAMAGMAAAQGVAAPLFRLLSGPPPEVDRALDALGFERRRDPETGVIEHANLFLLVDRRGRIAYRLGLGPTQERWLVEALRLLLREDVAG